MIGGVTKTGEVTEILVAEVRGLNPDFKSHEIRGQWSNNIDILAVFNLFILLYRSSLHIL